MAVFDQPSCPAWYPIPTALHPHIPFKPVHNDALIYLAVAVATFAAVPSFLWLRDRRHKYKERRRNRVVVESIKAKMGAAKALEAVPAPVPAPEPNAIVAPETTRDTDDVKDTKKRSKDRRKRNRDLSKSGKARQALPPSTGPSAHRDSQPPDYTPRAPDRTAFSSPHMPEIVSPMPVSLLSTSFHSPTPTPSPSRSENSSHADHSRSASASSTTAPLTPPSLPPSHPLPHPIIKAKNADSWALQPPHDDPAWDWDGHNSAYSSGSRAPSTSSCPRPAKGERLPRPPSPTSPSMPSAPSLVFPPLNAHSPPGASLSAQIASLRGALEASRTRENIQRREAERWSKDYDLIKWRLNEANDIWRKREAELQTQIYHLMQQLQTLTHTIQAASFSPPVAPLSFVPSQPPFPLAMSFPSFHHPLSPFPNGSVYPFLPTPTPYTSGDDMVNEGLVEAILKRPSTIQPFATPPSPSGGRVHRGEWHHGPHDAQPAPEADESRPKAKPVVADPIVEFEFPTLLERRRAPSPLETVVNIDGVEIFH